MPKLIIPTDEKGKNSPPPKVVAQYRRFIDRLPDKQVGFLKFSGKEDMKEAREALLEAALKSKKYIRIRKARGQDRTLQLQRCGKPEFEKNIKLAAAGTKKRVRKPDPKPKPTLATATPAEA